MRTMSKLKAQNAPRTDYKKWPEQFDGEDNGEGKNMKPVGALREPPTCPNRNRLGEIVVVQRGAFEPCVASGGVEAVKLDQAGFEHQTKKQPPDEKTGGPWRVRDAAGRAQ